MYGIHANTLVRVENMPKWAVDFSDVGVLIAPSIFWTCSLSPSTSSLGYLERGMSAPNLRVCSIPHIALEVFVGETDKAEASQHTCPNPRYRPHAVLGPWSPALGIH
jgi:hypothetical protein